MVVSLFAYCLYTRIKSASVTYGEHFLKVCSSTIIAAVCRHLLNKCVKALESLMRIREPTSSAFSSSLICYLIYLIFWCWLFSFCCFQFFVVISATKRFFNYIVNTYLHSTNLTYNFKACILTATLWKITSNYS